MLLVDAIVRPSQVHGLGLHATEFVPAGTKTWGFMAGFDLQLTEDLLNQLSPVALRQTRKYSYVLPGSKIYVLCGDDSRFMNHDDEPNSCCREDCMYAIRDIRPGEEITCDYAEFDATFQGTETLK